MRKRQKASDVFQDTDYWLREKVEFSQAFPEIENLDVEVTEYDFGHVLRSRHYSAHSAGEYINCSNKLCYNGGFHLGEIIRQMTPDRQVKKKVNLFCQGFEGSPKSRTLYDSCDHSFDVTVSLVYKSDKHQGE